MPVVPWDGTPLFGGKTLVLPGGAYKRKKMMVFADPVKVEPDSESAKPMESNRDRSELVVYCEPSLLAQ